jgi:hypothetical protein
MLAFLASDCQGDAGLGVWVRVLCCRVRNGISPPHPDPLPEGERSYAEAGSQSGDAPPVPRNMSELAARRRDERGSGALTP